MPPRKRKDDLHVTAISFRWEPDPDFGHLGHESCTAIAHIEYRYANYGVRRVDRLTSGGLYGIANPAVDYRMEIMEEQAEDLRLHIAHFGLIVPLEDWRQLVREAFTRKD